MRAKQIARLSSGESAIRAGLQHHFMFDDIVLLVDR